MMTDDLTQTAAAKALGVTRCTIYRWIRAGKIRAVGLRSKRRIPLSEVQRVLREQSLPPLPERQLWRLAQILGLDPRAFPVGHGWGDDPVWRANVEAAIVAELRRRVQADDDAADSSLRGEP
jgi:excisionase family DNA binding protein